MLALLSPAKRMDFASAPSLEGSSRPQLLGESARLMRTTRNLSQKKIRELMDISKELAKLNAGRYRELTTELSPANARQAILAFKGDVYLGLDAGSLSEEDLAFAQEHIGILSGLYGYLRPLDLIQPHRLEMGTRLKTRRGKSLYDFWGERITELVRAQLGASGSPILLNLASAEYFRSVQTRGLEGVRVITPQFYDTKDGKSRVLFAFAKKARGLMARYLVEHRITEPESVKGFDTQGYRFREEMSEGDTWAFERPQPPPPR